MQGQVCELCCLTLRWVARDSRRRLWQRFAYAKRHQLVVIEALYLAKDGVGEVLRAIWGYDGVPLCGHLIDCVEPILVDGCTGVPAQLA